jgi:hypothetical protein
MPIHPAALVRNVSSLAALDAEHDLPLAIQQIVSAAKALLRVDGAGLMLADERGELRWATASDQQTQLIEEARNGSGRVPASMRSPSMPRWRCATPPRNRIGEGSSTW